jgi:CO/xanthine dehydrogenase FAD-binding subunit
VKPAPFEYVDPRSIDEALECLAEHGDDAKVLAGGQSLVPMLNLRIARPAVVMDINRVAGLDALHDVDGVLELGALVRQRTVERWAARRAPLVAAALAAVGHEAIRNRGTVAGSLCHADPASELPALFLCLEGTAVIRSRAGERTVTAQELFVGPLTTSLTGDELVTGTRWPVPAREAGWGFHEIAPRHGDFALVGVAALATLDGGRVSSARIVVFGAGPTPLRATAAEQALAGARPAPSLIHDAAALVSEALDPMGDIHAPASYRKLVAGTLTERALTDALGRATEASDG